MSKGDCKTIPFFNKIMKMKRLIAICILIFPFFFNTFGQTAITVTEQTLRVKWNNEATLFYGFAKGDTIVLNLEEAGGKPIKEVDLLQYPDNSRFSQYEISIIENQKIVVPQNGIYELRIRNLALIGDRVCKVKLERIPANPSTIDFNTAVKWKKQNDTTYTYSKMMVDEQDTTYIPKTRKVKVNTEYKEDMFMQKNAETVYGTIGLGKHSNKTLIKVNLPKNVITPDHTEMVNYWVYWIGVGDESEKAWQKNVRMMTNVVKGALSIVGASPLIGYAVGVISDLAIPTNTDNVLYYLIDGSDNAQKFVAGQPFDSFEHGNGTGAYGKNSVRKQGTFYIGLKNDNKIEKIGVYIKVSVLWEITDYKDEIYQEMQLTPVRRERMVPVPHIKEMEVPMMQE